MHKTIDSLYLHFPFCTHLCNYCDFYKKVPTNITQDFNKFHDYLEQSFNAHSSLIKIHGYSWAPLKTFYIGGGTPSFWGETGSRFIKKFFEEKNISFEKDCEFTLEVNPGAWTDETLQSWRDLGANRFSLGIQTLNEKMIQFLDRSHDLKEVHRTLKYFKENRLNFSMDFMLGLPFSHENKRDVINELEMALEYGPSHFSVYILTVKDNYKHFQNLPNEEWIEKEFLQVAEYLRTKGFGHYEVSNFALPNKKSEHNLNYWRSKTVAALGPSATGFLNEEKIRYKWKPNSPDYELEKLTEEEFLLEQTYMALRSDIGIPKSKFKSGFDLLLKNWIEKNWAYESNSIIYLTSHGYLLLDSLMNDLFSSKLL